MVLNHIAMGGTKDTRKGEWQTPDALFQYYNAIYNFDLDAAADINNFKVANYITEEEDALRVDWSMRGSRVWLNHDFSLAEEFLEKAYQESRKEDMLVVVLLPANTGSVWFHKYAELAYGVFLLKGRIQFIAPPGVKQSSNPKDSAIFLFINLKPLEIGNIVVWDWKKNAKILGVI